MEDLVDKMIGKCEFSLVASLIAFLFSRGFSCFFCAHRHWRFPIFRICSMHKSTYSPHPLTGHLSLALSSPVWPFLCSRVAAKSAYSITRGTGRSLIHTIFTSATLAPNRNWNICRYLPKESAETAQLKCAASTQQPKWSATCVAVAD